MNKRVPGIFCALALAISACANDDTESVEDLTIVVEADRSEIDRRLSEVNADAARLEAERTELMLERGRLDQKLTTAQPHGGAPRDAAASDRLESLVDRQRTELLAAIEASSSATEMRALVEQLARTLEEQDEEIAAYRAAAPPAAVPAEVTTVLHDILDRLGAIERRLAFAGPLALTPEAREETPPRRRETHATTARLSRGARSRRVESLSLEGKREHSPEEDEGGGRLDSDAVARVTRLHRRGLQHCYEVEQRRAPDLSGKVEIELTIDDTGRVSQSAVASNTTGSAKTANCILLQTRRWQFPAPSDSPVTITIPLVIAPAG